MATEWTEEQKKVIEARDSNLLVSAAAGSGKTAVLIERIIRLLTDKENPRSVDRLLVVTFTKAAAKEMKDRLYKTLSEHVQKAEISEKENAALRRQLILLPQAKITTIDSFCSYIVRNYSSETDLSSNFRIADEGELALLKEDVINELLEKEYEKGSDRFIQAAEKFSSGKSDDSLASVILKIYQKSESSPYPEKWLAKAASNYETETEAGLEGAGWFKIQLEFLRQTLSGLAEICRAYAEFSSNDPETKKSYDIYLRDCEQLKKAAEFQNYEDLVQRIGSIKFETKKSVSSKNVQAKQADKSIQNKRDYVKDKINKLIKKFSRSEAEILAELKEGKETAIELIRLTAEFSKMYAQEKHRKNIADFSDIEHYALSVLKKDGKCTPVSDEIAAGISDIFIDEYQDSNLLQEEILTAVSGVTRGHNNIFMVGDMKQSIYRFREARPELFVNKYNTYSENDDATERKIELHANFRSRKEVVDSVNYFFYKLMKPEVGGISYDKKAALNPKASYKPTDKRSGGQTELVYINYNEENSENKNGRFEAEIRFAAKKILDYMNPENPYYIQAKDKSTKTMCYRPVNFGDFAVLFRNGGHYKNAAKILAEYGIPAFMESKAGYYDTWEVGLVLDYLRVIDNPLNDIPLAALMHSPVFSFTSEELARIRISGFNDRKGSNFYRVVRDFSKKECGEDEAVNSLIEKTKAFLEKIAFYRDLSFRTSLSMLVRRIISDNYIITLAAAMPGGDRRKANLTELIRKAENFENTSYHGVFQFLRYVDKLREHDETEGERNPSSENGDTVRLMTVHKSKGLEFPIVFLVGAQNKFNRQDERDSIILHPDFGIAFDNVFLDRRTKKHTFIKEAFKEILNTEETGEELRVLYVALTRAEEKLFIVGASENSEKLYNSAINDGPEKIINTEVIKGAGSYINWLTPSCDKDAPLSVIYSEDEEPASKVPEKEAALINSTEGKNAEEFFKSAEACYGYNYAYDDLRSIPASVSVSALKARVMLNLPPEESEAIIDTDNLAGTEDEDGIRKEDGTLSKPEESSNKGSAEEGKETVKAGTDIGKSVFLDEKSGGKYLIKPVIPRPDFIKPDKAGMTSAMKGTAAHFVMYKIDPEAAVTVPTGRWVSEGLITEEEAKGVSLKKVKAFFNSELGKRFRASYSLGKGFRERRFIVGLPAGIMGEYNLSREKDALVMLQGIIDMYFEENGELILVDYKTDNVKAPEELVTKYAGQLQLYTEALTQISGLRVSEKWIYSFKLEKAIKL